jgi:SAM-dependent methyltransferase
MPPLYDAEGNDLVPPRPLFDPAKPGISRVHDYLIGGHEYFDADRLVATSLLGVCPDLRAVIADGRAFLSRAVTWAAVQGVGQFLDLGCGFVNTPALHDVARAALPGARYAYVDNDPIVISHTNALHTYEIPGLEIVDADLTDPAAVLADKTLRSVIDLSEPVCALLGLVLAFLDTDRAREVVAGYVRQLAPGSAVAVSVPGSSDPVVWEKLRAGFTPALFSDHSPVMLYNHPAADVASFLKGMDLVQPGVVIARGWRGGWPDAHLASSAPLYALAAVARTL